MDFMDKVSQAVADKLFHTRGPVSTTLVITKRKKTAVDMLRDIRDGGPLYQEALELAYKNADPDDDGTSINRAVNVRRRLSNADVNIRDMRAGLYSGAVYFFPEKDCETAMTVFMSSSSGVPDIIVESGCSDRTKYLASEPSEEALEDLGLWIDSIPVV